MEFIGLFIQRWINSIYCHYSLQAVTQFNLWMVLFPCIDRGHWFWFGLRVKGPNNTKRQFLHFFPILAAVGVTHKTASLLCKVSHLLCSWMLNTPCFLLNNSITSKRKLLKIILPFKLMEFLWISLPPPFLVALLASPSGTKPETDAAPLMAATC